MNNKLKDQMESDWLEVCFRHSKHNHTDIPVQVLMSGLAAISRLVYLLSGAFVSDRSTPLKSTSDLRSQFEQHFSLRIGQSVAGSYKIPLRLDVREPSDFTNLLAPAESQAEQINGFKEFVDQSVMLVTNGEIDGFVKRFSEHSNAKRIASAVLATMPVGEFDTEIASKSLSDKLLVDSQRDRTTARSMLNKLPRNIPEPKLHDEEMTIVAQLEAYDLVSQTYRARSHEGLLIQGDVDCDLRDSKVRISPKQVEFDGVFQLDERNNIRSTKSILSSRRIDTSPIQVTEIQVNNELLKADPPLLYKVGFLKTDACYHLKGDLGLSLFAFSRSELESALTESLESWWLNYALEDDEKLSSGAQSLKQKLLSRFHTV